MDGHWQKETPTKSGRYWTADRRNNIAGIQVVVWDGEGRLVFAGHSVRDPEIDGWKGWWWSEPVEEPSPPTSDLGGS